MKFLLLILFFIYGKLFACEVIDDQGERLILKNPAQRVVSLAPDITENLFAIDAGDKIIGVVQGSDYPEAAKKIPVVATFSHIDIETLLKLHPDLIIAWSDTPFKKQLKKANIPVFWSHPTRLVDVPATLKRLGCLVGKKANAEKAAADFLKRYEVLQKKYQSKTPISVFYQVWSKPLITITEKSWIHDVILLCGGKNIFSHLKGTAPIVDLEAVLIANPDLIIGTDNQQHWQKQWEKCPKMHAVKNHHLYSMNPDKIERASLRLLEGALEICNAMDNVRTYGVSRIDDF